MSETNLGKKCAALDIVFLLDVTSGMRPLIEACSRAIPAVFQEAGSVYLDGSRRECDWRMRIMGFRDRDFDGGDWLETSRFSKDVDEVNSQLASLEAFGGGDEPQSLLDAMYQVSQWDSVEKGATPTTGSWRHRHDAARVVAIFTGANGKTTFTANDGSVGTVDDLIRAYHAARLEVILIAPEAPIYNDLSAMCGLEWEPVGELGGNPQQALVDFITDAKNCRNVMEGCIRSAFRAKAIYSAVIL